MRRVLSHRRAKHQAANPQTPEKFQIANPKPQKQMPGQKARRSVFELGASCLGSQLRKNCDAPPQCLGASWFLTYRPIPAYCREVNGSEQPSDAVPVGCFHTTHWTEVLAAGAENSPEAGEALARLCQTYWLPIYA